MPTREDWDEVKLMYEALTVKKHCRKELTSDDNKKIAGLKLKFAQCTP
jgi:hypothetical protein